MSRALTERLVEIARAARSAPHGQKEPIYQAAMAELNMSRPTLLRKLKEIDVNRNRKQRNDAGETALTHDEAKTIAGYLQETTRKNGKRLASLEDAVTVLRTNSMILAGRIDETTGEFFPLSMSAIGRALRAYGLHPDQLAEPAPAVELASLHPNHVWEIDASLCVLYYLKRQADTRANGLRVMDHREFYKNKPGNLAKIEHDRVWRYAITDHTSGAGYVEYVLGAESGENLASVFINAIQPRGHNDPLHGVPLNAMLDPGSANTGAIFKNLCRSLGTTLIVNKVGNPRAKGQVEGYHNIIERQFEAGLKLVPVNSLEELNANATRWRTWHNATKVHSRHSQTRNAKWLTITAEQLRVPPSADLCRELARTAPESRKVEPKLRVSFKGREYDVSDVPGLIVGQEVQVCRNPWRENAAQIVLIGEDGHEEYHVVEAVEVDEHGFAVGAPVIGENYKAHKDTSVQTALKDIERKKMNVATDEAAATARKAKTTPYGGKVDPYRHMDPEQVPTYLPKKGMPVGTPTPRVVLPNLTLTELCIRVARHMGKDWNPEFFPRVRAWYPEGAPETEIPAVAERLRNGEEVRQPPKLVAVK
jgi:hypothetical protein